MQDRAGLSYLLHGSSRATQRAGRPLDLQDTWRHELSPPQKEHRKSPAPLGVCGHLQPVSSRTRTCVLLRTASGFAEEAQNRAMGPQKKVRPVGVAGPGWGRRGMCCPL